MSIVPKDQDTEVAFDKHPALRNFNRTVFMVKHVAKNLLKWGAIGAAAGAVAAAGLGIGLGLSLGGIGLGIGTGLSYFFPAIAETVKGTVFASLSYGGVGGALIGAAAGGIVAAANASEAADAEEDRLVAKYEQQEARRDRMAALERRRDEQRFAMEKQGYAMSTPGHHIPKGRQQGGAGLVQA